MLSSTESKNVTVFFFAFALIAFSTYFIFKIILSMQRVSDPQKLDAMIRKEGYWQKL